MSVQQISQQSASMASTPATLTIRPTLAKTFQTSWTYFTITFVHTIANVWIEVKPLSYIVKTFHKMLDQGLPHLVVTFKDQNSKIENVFDFFTRLSSVPDSPLPMKGHGTRSRNQLLEALSEALKARPVSEKSRME